MLSPVFAWLLTRPEYGEPSAARSGITRCRTALPSTRRNRPIAGSKSGSASTFTPFGPSTFGPRSVTP